MVIRPAARESWDVIVAGGGPAGLAAAIVAAEQGRSVLVLERRDFPPDKACGEGVLPPGVRALERLGVVSRLDRTTSHRIAGVRFIQEDGSSVDSMLPGAGGLGIRRTVLVEALTRRAVELGAVVRHRCPVQSVETARRGAAVRTANGQEFARLIVAADGLHSALRRDAGLEAGAGSPRRFGLRQHWQIRPWTDFVEVYVDARGEAFVTPVSSDSVGVSFMWEDGTIDRPTIASLASRFPALEARLRAAAPMSSPAGAGPMAQRVVGRTRERMILIGDAAGFVDSISADGLSIAFNSALILGKHLPAILAQGATRASLQPYEREVRRLFRRYWIITHGMLQIARRPRARAAIIRFFAQHPGMTRAMMNGAMRLMVSAA